MSLNLFLFFTSNGTGGQQIHGLASTPSIAVAHVANEGVSLENNNCSQNVQKQQSRRNDNYKSKTNSSLKPSFLRTLTLMKPTASQLAKQNQERLVDKSRFQKSGNSSLHVEDQPSKRE